MRKYRVAYPRVANYSESLLQPLNEGEKRLYENIFHLDR